MSNPDAAAHGSAESHPSVAHIIASVARELGIPPQVALALGLYESGLDPHSQGDGGTSFGIYQLHEGGELGSHSPEWAYSVRNNASTALGVVARVHNEHPDWDWGRVVAAAQRPADQQAEASAVNAILGDYHASGQDAVAYFSSRSAGTSTGGTGTAGGAPVGDLQLSQKDVSSALDSLGFPKALIESTPSLHHVFNEILREQIDLGTDTGQARAIQLLKSTHWWQNRTKSQREFDTRMADPAEQKSLLHDIHQKREDIKVAAAQMGIDLNPDQLDHLARVSLRNGLDDAELNHALAGHFNYNPNQPLQGTVAADVHGLQQLAAQYFVNLNDNKVQHLVQRMLNGELQPQDVSDFIKQQAMSRFPHLEQQLNKGFTVQDIAAPYMQAYSDILGVNPTSIGVRDPLLMQALQMPDGKGGFQLMPEWQFEQQLRKDPRWQNTPDAHNSLMSAGVQILRDWGLSA